MKTLTEQQIEYFKKLARRSTTFEVCEESGEDWNPCEFSGANFDDAYQAGYNDAEIGNARLILSLYNIQWRQ